MPTVEDLLAEQRYKNEPPTPPAREESQLFGRQATKSKVIKYLKCCEELHEDVFDGQKFSLLGSSGVKGIGKTELHKQICTNWVTSSLGEKAEAIYISYSGGGKAGAYCQDASTMEAYKKTGWGWIESMGHLLLVTCGVDKKVAVQADFDQAIAFVRSQLGEGKSGQLVICVDEIIHLDEVNEAFNKGKNMTLAQLIMSECMGRQDKEKGKLIFIFTAILDSMYTKLMSQSGRRVAALPLNMIPLCDVFGSIIDDRLRELAKTQPGVHQLILSCAGHPRATVDGLKAAHQYLLPTDAAPPSTIYPSALAAARTKVIDVCKFKLGYLDESIVGKWFDLRGASCELRQDLLSKGILHSIDGVEFLFPLLLHEWARKNQSLIYGHHLSQLFDADLGLDNNAEKLMEPVMYHYEAVLRKAMEGQKFDLRLFYKSEHCGMSPVMGTAKVPNSTSLVYEMEDFDDIDKVLGVLRDGFIVVSKAHSEVGVEYLAPFEEVETGRLFVACVQCKFVRSTTNWQGIKTKMKKAVEKLAEKKVGKYKVEHFPVVYTTVDQQAVLKKTCKDGAYFIERDIFEFTKRLGILRLHTQKLGTVLTAEYPFLKELDHS